MSEGLQRVREEVKLPTIEALLSDIWASFYKMKPRVIEECESILKVNRTLMEQLLKNEQFENHRHSTKLDDFESVICTVLIGEKLNKWLAEIIESDREFGQLIDTIESAQQQFSVEQNEEEIVESSEVKELEEATDELDEKLQMALEVNGERLAQGIGEALEESIQIKDNVVSLIGGTGIGKGDAELKKVPLRDQLDLADQLISNIQLQNIAEWAGRFQQIAHDKKRKDYTEAVDRRGVVQGNDIEKILPAELGLYSHPVAKTEFLRRYAEGETMQYDQKKRADQGEGPIVFCFDQSGSMSELDNQAKGFILALLSIAENQNRDLCVVFFSTTVQRFTYTKGKITTAELTLLAKTYLGGGTDFSLALKEVLEIINESAFSKADLLFITDGEDDVSESFLEKFLSHKKEKEFQVLSLIMGEDTSGPEKFSDRVLKVIDFHDEGSFAAFEI